MSNDVKRNPCSSAGRPLTELRNETYQNREFKHRLQELLDKKGWKQSQLARAAFGSEITKDGHNVAKGRDRVSAYINGKQIPDAYNMKKLADALGVPVEELAPDITGAAIVREKPELYIQKVPNRDYVIMFMEKTLPVDIAYRIFSLILEADNRALSEQAQRPRPLEAHNPADLVEAR